MKTQQSSVQVTALASRPVFVLLTMQEEGIQSLNKYLVLFLEDGGLGTMKESNEAENLIKMSLNLESAN